MTSYRVHDLPLTVASTGEGRPLLLLHGGGGPATVAPWGEQLAAARRVRVLTPTHPGFNGTPRPDSLSGVRELAALYSELLDVLELEEATVVGNSIGGWIAAEMAVIGSPRLSGVVILDAVGLEVEGHPYVDFFSLTPAEIAARSYADPTGRALDPASLPPEARAALAGNRETLGRYAGQGMTDPSLAARLGGVTVPTLSAWGEADRISDPAVGEAYAAAIPGARFELIAHAGHLPQLEAPERLIELVADFAGVPALS